MPTEESPEDKYERLKRQLQESILRDYPNPERKGCPSYAVLKELAERPLAEEVQDEPSWQHVTHCSECYREFLELNGALRQQSANRKAKARFASGIGVALVVVAGLFFATRHFSLRPQNAEQAYSQKTIDIPSITRSTESGAEAPTIVLEHKPTQLQVNLPVGSKPGNYEFELRKGTVNKLSRSADATMRNGLTAFQVKLPLMDLEPGMYTLRVRRVPWDWTHFPVEIR